MATAKNLPAPEMDLRSDLSRLIEGQLDKHGISYDRSMPLDRLAARYFEMSQRWIQPVPRRVHFSDRIYAWLGKIMRRGRNDPAALDAWFTVFRLRRLLVHGANVNAFLGRNSRDAYAPPGEAPRVGMVRPDLFQHAGLVRREPRGAEVMRRIGSRWRWARGRRLLRIGRRRYGGSAASPTAAGGEQR